MTYLSVCSGIEATSVAWESLEFTPLGFSEIERFPCAVLQKRFPNVKNYGDVTQYEKWTGVEAVDILVGGTPCQSFSIAGKRGGLSDIRGRLMHSYLGIVGSHQPRWVVWENVPGVLSSGGGADFASLLSGLEKLGYGWAYRVLDSQYFGVPQRRRRVFVVGHSGNRTDLAAKVLFEPENVRRDIAEGERTQKKITSSFRKNVEYFRRGGYYKYHEDEHSSTLTSKASSDCMDLIFQNGTIRRLTPLECERLQGFPDNWTQISYRGKPADECPDTPRYKAIGNSMAVPVMKWIGERIRGQEHEEILHFKQHP